LPIALTYIIEIATSDFLTTKSAVTGGADRIELCSNLAEGGVTPSYGLIMQCREAFDTLLYPIIRPRGGDFLYTDEEFEIMLHDVKLCKQLGCDGIVTGLLKKEGNIDKERTKILAEAAYPMGVTFHRAFDRCRDPFAGMEDIIAAGCERILTSGQKPIAPEGVQLIADLYNAADHRIIIMPGSGVRKENIKMLADKTGCIEFHSSLRGKIKSKMDFIHDAFRNSEESYNNNHIDKDEVLLLKNALNT
jgi:copper homeostasis protein